MLSANISYFIFIFKIIYIISRHRNTDPWCSGNTTDFGSVIWGSNPCGSTSKIKQSIESTDCFIILVIYCQQVKVGVKVKLKTFKIGNNILRFQNNHTLDFLL